MQLHSAEIQPVHPSTMQQRRCMPLRHAVRRNGYRSRGKRGKRQLRRELVYNMGVIGSADGRLFRNSYVKAAVLSCALLALGACSSIRESRGFIDDPVLTRSVEPGIDNLRSVEGTLGRPTFASQYGEPVWYYISSTTGRRPFVRPKISNHSVLAVHFDAEGDVISVNRSGIDEVVYLQPDGDLTPTLGRERSFLEDLFGNIGQVSAGAPGGAGP